MGEIRYLKSGFKKDNLETIIIDGLIYRKSNKRMIYDPKVHFNHGKLWTTKELAMLVRLREDHKWPEIAIILGRTHDTCAKRYSKLKKDGELDKYMNMNMAI